MSVNYSLKRKKAESFIIFYISPASSFSNPSFWRNASFFILLSFIGKQKENAYTKTSTLQLFSVKLYYSENISKTTICQKYTHDVNNKKKLMKNQNKTIYSQA